PREGGEPHDQQGGENNGQTSAHENGAVLAQGSIEGIRSVIANGPAWVKENNRRPLVETLAVPIRFSHFDALWPGFDLRPHRLLSSSPMSFTSSTSRL